MTTAEDILAFWFPPGLDADQVTHRRQFEWWFRGGADQAIVGRYQPVLAAASRGELDAWADEPRARLALIIVLDQFSRTVYRGSAQAFAQDGKALGLAHDGLERGHYNRLPNVWEKTFFVLPLGHSEQIALLERCVGLCEALIDEAPEHCARSMRSRPRRRAAIATSSPGSAAIPTATPCWAGRRPRRSAPTSRPASWFIGACSGFDGPQQESLLAARLRPNNAA